MQSTRATDKIDFKIFVCFIWFSFLRQSAVLQNEGRRQRALRRTVTGAAERAGRTRLSEVLCAVTSEVFSAFLPRKIARFFASCAILRIFWPYPFYSAIFCAFLQEPLPFCPWRPCRKSGAFFVEIAQKGGRTKARPRGGGTAAGGAAQVRSARLGSARRLGAEGRRSAGGKASPV